MIDKAKSIALHTVRYGENSLVAYMYTYEFGRITLMVNAAHGKGKGAKKAIFFQPLTLTNLIFYPGKNHGMGRLKEISPYVSLNSIYINPIKRAIALFIGEVIYRSVREEESNPPLYHFLEASIQSLDALENGVSNFHLLFLALLSKHLGFFPNGSYSDQTPFFDYKNGFFVKSEPNHPLFFTPEYAKILSNSLYTGYENADALKINGSQRSAFLSKMLLYYSYHTDSVQNIKSLPILSQVFDE
ncbi:MAG: DNA repair protein RecO [Bacteroidetes bacterium HGW-Bacteroidetes-15]|nr:MAG: DNA repair protein RecO [Bacteroidetes bacterium HGW-Bacteroidetes-15]